MKRVNAPVGRLFCLVLAALLSGPAIAAAEDRAAWITEARWGVMTHYLADWIAEAEGRGKTLTVEQWNDLVDQFDVEGLAKQLEAAGAGYQVLTIGQNSGFYLAPNPTYDRLVGISPSHCSRRDLVVDLSEALRRRGIKLIVYLPAGAPARDKTAAEALEWHDGPHRNSEFQLKWEQVIGDWSRRWGTKVAGWWFDGCYWPNTMYRTGEPPDFASFAAAARAGNPDAIVAFNPGVVDRILSITPHEDYTAGEINDLDRLMIRRAVAGKVDGARIHVLSFLGTTWGKGSPRFSEEQLVDWSRKISRSGAVTWDVPIGRDGTLPRPFLDQLNAVGRAIGRN
jgi:alpha-L-fucosidase